jgi:hypothetical protein
VGEIGAIDVVLAALCKAVEKTRKSSRPEGDDGSETSRFTLASSSHTLLDEAGAEICVDESARCLMDRITERIVANTVLARETAEYLCDEDP